MLFKNIAVVHHRSRRLTYHAISPPALEAWLKLSGVDEYEFLLQGFSGKGDAVTRERSQDRLVFGSAKDKYMPGDDVLSDLRRLVEQEEGGDPPLEFLHIVVSEASHYCSICYQFERPGQSRRQQPEPKKS